jgi:enoyl-CoA hydratase/carnithine racemase/3-hydroxyacyl-CoA dehydrogenase
MPPSASGAVRRQRVAVRRGVPALPGVEMRQEGAALVLRFGTPGPGAWSAAFAADVARLVSQCRDDARARVVVLTGPLLFAEGAPGGLPALCGLLEAVGGAGTPVVAAIPGEAMGSGLELALACHARAAAPGAVLGFPGVRQGVLPVNGGAGRLARLLAPEAALEMLGFGAAVPAGVALRLGLVDAVAEDPVAALPGAAGVKVAGRFDPAALEAVLRRRAPGEAAPRAALQALAHAVAMPAQRALAETRQLAVALAASPQGRALRHAALAEAAVAQADGGRLRWALLREAIHLVDEGAGPEAVDLALRRFGFTTPPLAACDRDGLEAVARDCVDARADAWIRYSPLLDLLIDAGRTGRAAGAGWYRYVAGQVRPLPDPALLPLLAESAAAGCRRRRAVAEEEIVGRCLAALAGEAAALVGEGHAALAVDGLSLALGFPRWRGGIWHHVREAGAAGFAARLAGMSTVPAATGALLAG